MPKRREPRNVASTIQSLESLAGELAGNAAFIWSLACEKEASFGQGLKGQTKCSITSAGTFARRLDLANAPPVLPALGGLTNGEAIGAIGEIIGATAVIITLMSLLS